ncbi:unnamed protein product [Miscanthus lutarioriparius]|uniref:CASP-like protein n=1 Tax=Miscanthus lutarioriparius TaxID=422564 RepID=A0A811QBX0_9POAL|nr:unnamed protein product [Miscanthus lutarioriparius]
MAFSDSERAAATASLLLRVLTLLLLVASIVILVTNKIYAPFRNVVDPPNITFRDFYAYRYVLSAAVIGGAYTLLVLPFAAIHVAQERRIGRDRRAIALLIFTDVVFAVLIATGAAAGLGLTVESQRFPQGPDFANFFKLVDVSCGLMLVATLCMVIIIMVSVRSIN